MQLAVHRAGTHAPITRNLTQAAAGQDDRLDRFRLLGRQLVQQGKGPGAAGVFGTVQLLFGGRGPFPFV